ncbi:MAG: MarR family winged helix-turn-helix transcriptional regulator [Promethearchaeota archaeon]
MITERRGGFFISKIHQISGRIFTKKLKEYKIEINPAQGRILFVLWEKDGISIQELAQKTSLGKSTLTSMLNRLEKAEYIQLKRSSKDDRKKIITLTEKDKQLHEKYEELSKEMNQLFYNGFSNKEIDIFEQFLQKALQNLTDFYN